MKDYIFDLETCSEKYKEHIRSIEYGDSVEATTKEHVIFIYKDKKIIVTFTLKFSFDFINGFNYTDFSYFESSRKVSNYVMKEFEKYIRSEFVNSDRLSC